MPAGKDLTQPLPLSKTEGGFWAPLYNSWSVHLSQLGEGTDQMLGALLTLQDSFSQLSMVSGQNKKPFRLGATQPRAFYPRDLSEYALCHLKVTVSPCFYLNLTPLLFLP